MGELFGGLNMAIANSGKDVKSKLGDEVSELLDQLEYSFYIEHTDTFNAIVGHSYDVLRDLIVFKLVSPTVSSASQEN